MLDLGLSHNLIIYGIVACTIVLYWRSARRAEKDHQ